jgi:pre-mRNA-splicing factor SYF1
LLVCSIYDRATTAVADGDRAAMFTKYIAKAEEYFGATKTRDIYAKAIEALPDKEAKDFCLKFAALEKRLGEIDRARAILVHGSQFCDPRTEAQFWEEWQKFEAAHGNPDTYREVLRIKRSVAAQFSSVNVATQELLAQAEELKKKEKELKERAAAAIAATTSDTHKRKRERPANWDEEGGAIVDKDDEPLPAGPAESEDDEDELEQKALPSSLFGDSSAADSDRPPVSGALNLFKRQKPVE